MAEKDIVERLREAFQRKRYGGDGHYDPDFDLFDVAADLIDRLRARAPEGWKLVPLLATDDMKIKGAEVLRATAENSRESAASWTYTAMLASSPEPSSEGRGDAYDHCMRIVTDIAKASDNVDVVGIGLKMVHAIAAAKRASPLSPPAQGA